MAQAYRTVKTNKSSKKDITVSKNGQKTTQSGDYV